VGLFSSGQGVKLGCGLGWFYSGIPECLPELRGFAVNVAKEAVKLAEAYTDVCQLLFEPKVLFKLRHGAPYLVGSLLQFLRVIHVGLSADTCRPLEAGLSLLKAEQLLIFVEMVDDHCGESVWPMVLGYGTAAADPPHPS
jgi:hypothetical protein